MKRKHCPTGKLKHFNEAWADITAERQSEDFGCRQSSYRCTCGWWHTYNRSKKRTKEQQREPRNARRRRSQRGEPPPFQMLREQEARERKRLRQLRKRQRADLPLRTWEDDGGACVWSPGSPDEEEM